jgi:hypothetical protein
MRGRLEGSMHFDEEQFRADLRAVGAPQDLIDRLVADQRARPEQVPEEQWRLAGMFLEDLAAHVPHAMNDQGGYEFDHEAVQRYLETWESLKNEDPEPDPDRN